MSTIDDTVTVRTGSDADALVLLLHGFGSNEQDLPGLAAHLPAGLATVSVRAPLTLGPGSYAWVPITVPGRPDPAIVAASTEALLAWFDDRVPADRPVVLLGFSQGGLMVSQLLRARPERFVAALVLSGFVLDADLPGDAALAVRHVPVFFGHGDADPVIAPDATQRASVWLAEHAATTERTYAGLAHAISAEELEDVGVFLRAHVPGLSAP
ncbi:MAG: putative esterase [Aeromicrobium sp.]|uniref:alpha/beta hydrolase n=1 Tax=Aeromicrobium sp. TaxID=1871063 RepID=UPI0026193655|nr:alpha/beta fold hydrolase [Aeromicrobium sp.]MCW2825977.1 putative esterase [Aeromicrobium sp.]